MKLKLFKRSSAKKIDTPSEKPKVQTDPILEKHYKKQRKLRAELTSRQTADFYYFIDIAGTCNLRCPSCPVGNYDKSPIGVGRMKLDKYVQTLDKIIKEHPNETIFIDLYNWGEPGLHKNLTEIVSLTKEKGMGVGISSNLNFFPDMKNVLKAEPDYIRISLSGFDNEVYQQTHRKGDINMVKSNMHLMRYWLDKLESNTIIQVGFHIYKTNFPNDFLKMQTLCHDLGFIFAPVVASIMPAEKALRSMNNDLTPQDQKVADKLVVTLEEAQALYKPYRSKHTDCQYRQVRTAINYDGSVPLCCATYEKPQFVSDNFLEVSRKELKKRKYQHPFCKQCMSACLHIVYLDVEQLVNNLAIERLGPIYAKFVEECNKPQERWVEWQGNEYSSQDAYDLALNMESSNPSQAINCYKALLKAFPRHGEALYNLGKLIEASEGAESATQYYKKAFKLVPEDQRYKHAYLASQNNKLKMIETLKI